jgi:hypothetical protein
LLTNCGQISTRGNRAAVSSTDLWVHGLNFLQSHALKFHRGEAATFFVLQTISTQGGSSLVRKKTLPMEPTISGNIAQLPSLSARAMQTREETFMTNRFMMSVAAVALIAGTGFANAQGTGREPSAGTETQKSAPAPKGTTTPMNRESTLPAGRPSEMKGAQSEQKPAAGENNKRAEENNPAQKSKGMTSEMNDNSKGKDAKDMKAEGAERNGNERNGNMNAETKGGAKEQTTGQAAAGGGKMTSEQRTRISSVIRDQHVTSVTNVNFSISVGTRVPRDVEFHPLPAEIVTIYPDWRGYEFIMVRNQIVVIDPRTFEIVAVLDA